MTPQRVRSIVLAVALAVFGASPAAANPRLLKSNVVIVKPQFHKQTRDAFRTWSSDLLRLAEDLERKDLKLASATKIVRALAGFYDNLATSPGHGSGWLWIPAGGSSAYVVTNRHVAGQAGTVTIEFDGERLPELRDNPVLYVDPIHDMAVIEVARDRLPAGAEGFELIDTTLTEGNPVWAAGFPGTDTDRGMIAAYSLTNGIVSNAEFPGPEGDAIAHTATIDPGNSGGPLLVEVPTASMGYRVAGMNTWKSNARTNVNLSIPAPVIRQVLESAMEAREIGRDRARLAEALRRRATRLADELGSPNPDAAVLDSMISYSFVAQRPRVIGINIRQLVSGEMTDEQLRAFESSPVEYARGTLLQLFYHAFSTAKDNVAGVTMQRIVDESRISADARVRVVYLVGSKRQEMVWAWEHGAWRITDASFENALGDMIDAGGQGGQGGGLTRYVESGPTRTDETKADGKPGGETTATATAAAARRWRPGIALALRAGSGRAGATGENFAGELDDQETTELSLELLAPFNRHLWFVFGASYDPMGADYLVSNGESTALIRERATYVQVPLGLRLEVPIQSRSATVRLFGRAALSLDVAAQYSGSFEIGGATGSLTDPELDWYEEHNLINIAAQYGGGVEVGFGATPSIFIGLDVTSERHLLREWTDEFFSGGANYRYHATRAGLSLKYQSQK